MRFAFDTKIKIDYTNGKGDINMKSKVYFTDMRVKDGDSLLNKLDRLISAAGISSIDFSNKFTAIKIHFGEPGNMAHIRPQYARVLADKIISLGGKPFLTDCNTLYVGKRGNGIDHLQAAYENGWNYGVTHCQNVIADGIKGYDEELIEVNGQLVKTAKIGKAIADADIIVTLNHFKGHELAGFGGAIKNLGMGSGSRRGKMEQHCEGKLAVKADKCRGCRVCAKFCAQSAISYIDNKAQIDLDKCVGCGMCLPSCNFNAIYNKDYCAAKNFDIRLVEYTKAVVQNKPQFHVSLAIDITPVCDCRCGNDTPIIPNVGFFASFDPVALDCACANACNESTPLPDSRLTDALENNEDRHDLFYNVNRKSDYRFALNYAEELGIGTQDYELIKIK